MDPKSNVENNATESTPVAEGQQSTNADNTPANQDGNGAGETMADAMAAAYKKHTGGSESSTDDGNAEDGSVLEKHETDEANEGEQTEEATEGEEEPDGQEETAEAEPTDEDKKKLSFQDHPDWKKMVETKNTLEAQVNQYKPLADAQLSIANHLTENGISPEQFQEGMRFMTLLYTDPLKFKEEFSQTWGQLSSLTGDQLPADLQEQMNGIEEEVEAGTLTKQRADQLKANIKDIAKLRGQDAVRKTRGELDQKRQLENQQRQFQQEVTTTVTSWAASKQKTDVSFKPTSDKTKPGRYEMVLDLAKGYAVETPIKTAADAVKLLEKAYEVTKGFANGAAPKKPSSGPVLTSTRSSITSTNKTEPKTMQEAMLNAAKAHGVRR